MKGYLMVRYKQDTSLRIRQWLLLAEGPSSSGVLLFDELSTAWLTIDTDRSSTLHNRELAQMVGVSESHISRIFTPDRTRGRNPSRKLLRRIAKALDMKLPEVKDYITAERANRAG